MDAVSARKALRRPKQASSALLESEVSKLILAQSVDVVGNYTLGRTIGEGSFGKVKLGVHGLTGVTVAVKIVDKIHAPTVIREVETWRHMHHPHIAQLYEVVITETRIYMVMEYCPGGEAFEYIVRHGRVSENSGQAQALFRQLAEAVGYCHQRGFVHRDLKLENILLTTDMQVKLIDFGFTREYTRSSLLQTYCGSLAYAAPEMIQGTKYDGPAADVWSLGVILYALVCGTLPFEDRNEAVTQRQILALEYSVPADVSRSCADLIQRILVLDPAQRLSIPDMLNHEWMSSANGDQQSPVVADRKLDLAFTSLGRAPSFCALASSSFNASAPSPALLAPQPGSPMVGTSSGFGALMATARAPEQLAEPTLPLPGAPFTTSPTSSASPTSLSSPSSTALSNSTASIGGITQAENPPPASTLTTATYSFASTQDVVLITALQSIGFDVAAIMKSVAGARCDANSALWYLLQHKQQQPLHSVPHNRLHLEIQPPQPAATLNASAPRKSSAMPEIGSLAANAAHEKSAAVSSDRDPLATTPPAQLLVAPLPAAAAESAASALLSPVSAPNRDRLRTAEKTMLPLPGHVSQRLKVHVGVSAQPFCESTAPDRGISVVLTQDAAHMADKDVAALTIALQKSLGNRTPDFSAVAPRPAESHLSSPAGVAPPVLVDVQGLCSSSSTADGRSSSAAGTPKKTLRKERHGKGRRNRAPPKSAGPQRTVAPWLFDDDATGFSTPPERSLPRPHHEPAPTLPPAHVEPLPPPTRPLMRRRSHSDSGVSAAQVSQRMAHSRGGAALSENAQNDALLRLFPESFLSRSHGDSARLGSSGGHGLRSLGLRGFKEQTHSSMQSQTSSITLESAEAAAAITLPAVLVVSVNVPITAALPPHGNDVVREAAVSEAAPARDAPALPALGSGHSGSGSGHHTRRLSVARKPSQSIMEEDGEDG